MIIKLNKLFSVVISTTLSITSTSFASALSENLFLQPSQNHIFLENSDNAKLINTMIIRKPINIESMTNEYQEVLNFKDLGDSVKVTLKYNLITSYNSQIKQNKNWQSDYKNMHEYLSPGKTADWDAQMQKDLLTELKTVGIDPSELTDKQLVEKVSVWIFSKFAYDSFFIPYFVSFKSGEPSIILPADNLFKNLMNTYNISNVQQAFKRGLSGKSMYYSHTHGDCTASAILISTVMRALGIPTRIILTVPSTDVLDVNQKISFSKNLGTSLEEKTVLSGIDNIAAQSANFKNGAFIAHTFNEVFVGNEWVKLNYSELGQGNVWSRMGLITQVNTFKDWSDAYPVVESWGSQFATEITAGGKITNPYSSVPKEKTNQ